MKRLKEAIKKKGSLGRFAVNKQDFINHFLEGCLKNAIKWASLQDINQESLFHDPEEYELGKDNNRLSDALFRQDNNNGFFICIISSDLKTFKYAFISGLEDEEQHNVKTPEQYVNLFYKGNDLSDVLKRYAKEFKDYKKFKFLDTEIEYLITELNKLRKIEQFG